MIFNPANGPFHIKKEITSMKGKQCPCCKAEMKPVGFKNDYVDDWRYECSNCYHWEY